MSNRSKFLSLLLRHKPEHANLTLNKEGWCDIWELIKNTDFTIEELEKIVAEDSKQRYSILYWEMGGEGLPYTREPMSIRANQGHSTDVKLTFKTAVPPPELFHGADEQALPSILKSGLMPMKRHHVHLSKDRETAIAVGSRRKSFRLLRIDAEKMLYNGYKFYISDNGVWLIDAVPPPFITIENL